MTHPEQSKSKTADRLEDFFQENTLILTPLLGIKNDFEDCKSTNDSIKEKIPLQITDETGTTISKELVKSILVKELLSNTGPACSCFDKTGDIASFNKINFKEYVLKRATPSELNALVEVSVKILTDNLLILTEYGVTVVTIAKITTAQLDFNSVSNVPEELITESTVNTKEIKALFRLLTRIIKIRLKNSMLLIRETHPEIYNHFLAITHDIIIGAHSHHDPSVVTGLVYLNITDINTNENIEGASTKAVGFPLVILTDETGMAVHELEVGKPYVIKVISFDYKPIEISVTATLDDQTIKVKLTPVSV